METKKFNNYEFRLKTLHKMRWLLLEMSHECDEDGYNNDFYVEANEILNEVEARTWQLIEEEK